EPLRPAHFERVLTASLEIVERFSPILGFRHAYVLPHGGFVARPVLWWRPAAPGYAALAIATSYGGDPLRPATPRWRSPRICRVTYWIAYCKVTRIADVPRLKVRHSSAGHPESRSFTSEHNHDGRGRQLAGGPVGVHRR